MLSSNERRKRSSEFDERLFGLLQLGVGDDGLRQGFLGVVDRAHVDNGELCRPNHLFEPLYRGVIERVGRLVVDVQYHFLRSKPVGNGDG